MYIRLAQKASALRHQKILLQELAASCALIKSV
jgi:hypothetical protein